jgi:hypothetical protein
MIVEIKTSGLVVFDQQEREALIRAELVAFLLQVRTVTVTVTAVLLDHVLIT